VLEAYAEFVPSLTILTWNIWMMPSWTGTSPKNDQRASAVADQLAAQDIVDILVLVKAFDGSAREVIAKKLGARFPYRYGPLNDAGSPLKINGGVWVLSRSPLRFIRQIQFRDSGLVEGFSRKGAALFRGEVDGRAFQLIGTHLQGEEGPREQNQPIRDRQIAQIARELIAGSADLALPLFICGDLNTQRRDRTDPFVESPSYTSMIATFEAENSEEFLVTLDDRRVHNDLADYDTGRVAELDYVLVRRAGHAITGSWRDLILRQQGWDGPNGRRDLSYRYAVLATFQLP
jgi:endonuclease/exonuclease/phosphatase family metal-dependent hydrolase